MKSLRKIIHKTEKGVDKLHFEIKDKLGLFDPVIIFPYRGFGNQEVAYLRGRILEKEGVIHGETEMADSFWHNLRKIWKRYESDEVPGVELEAEMHGFKTSTTSDAEGYFTLEFKGLEAKDMPNGWYEVDIRIAHIPFDLEYEECTKGEILISQQDNAFGIISDVDDTIIKSHAMNPLQKINTMLNKNAASRVPFEGVGKLYHLLIEDYRNPLIFVSGSSYNLYDMLTAFCEHNKIPKAPFLLRDLGLNAKRWIKQDTKPYKITHIERVLDTYDKLSFICIGDSGQQDPEIYAEIYNRYPGRVKAIYIRHVHTDERKKELEKMAEDFDIPFLVLADSKEAVEHAVRMEWVKG